MKLSAKKTSTEDSPRIGVFVCHCGTNIAGVIDVKKVAKASLKYKNVVYARDHEFACSEGGQELIKKTSISIKKTGNIIFILRLSSFLFIL